MNKRKISFILATATIASMSSTMIPSNLGEGRSNKILLARSNSEKSSKKDINKFITNNVEVKKSNVSSVTKEGLENNKIVINNVWNQALGTISFNPETQKIQYSGGWSEGNPYVQGEVFAITLFNSDGAIIKTVKVNGGEYPESALNNAFNNLNYSYGDLIKIDYKTSSKIDITNFNNESNYAVNKNITMEITKNGLKELGNNITLNNVYYSLNSTSVEVSGSTTSNTNIYVNIDNKIYNTTSNSNGKFSLNINTGKEVTASTEIQVYAKGQEIKEVNPILNPNIYKIENNIITLNNVWNQNIGSLKFNPVTKKISFNEGWTEINPYLSGEAFSINLYSSNGELLKSVTMTGGEYPEEALKKAFNNESFSYGDILQINYKTSSKISISNFNGEKEYSIRKSISLELTQNGLKELESGLKVNKIYYTLNSNKINISGTTNVNTDVYVNVDNKVYSTKSNNKGQFNLNISAPKNVTSSTVITVYAAGQQIEYVTPEVNPNIYGIVKNNISLIGNWYGGLYKAATIAFNPETMKLNISGSMRDYFANGTGKAFKISLYSKNGSLIKTKTFNNSNQTKNLYDDFNNLGFSYGDIIKVSSLGKGQVKVSNYDGQSNYLVSSSTTMTITQDGLVPCKLPEIKVNPFEVLGNGKVTSGVISGISAKPNQVINVIVDGKTFTTKSNEKGTFSVNISDPSGFTEATNIVVEASGEVARSINPTVDSKLGILNSNIALSNSDNDDAYGNLEQYIGFNPVNMSIISKNIFGRNFAAQLINGQTGQVLASCGANDFNAFTSQNNLNGAHFQYGDIIAVYEPEENELSLGEVLLDNGKSKVDCTNKFKCFKITPNGLVPVENKNLTTSQVLYTGSENLTLTGKTLPNTNVTVSYGNMSKVVKSNNSGDFSLEIPITKAPINSEVRVFVNRNNTEILTVKYDSKEININSNRIEILNNTSVPVFNIKFNPVDNKLEAVKYPITMGYTGAFYGNSLNIKLINSKTGKSIYSFDGNKLNDIDSFVSAINNKSYVPGDIIEVSYNPNFIKADVYDGKQSVGNTTGAKEYFEITNKGLVNLNDKFINVKPVDILSNTKVTSTKIEGQAKPNTLVEISVDGNTFKGTTSRNGDFSIPIRDESGFTSNTDIVVLSEGYIPTIITPTIESNIELMNSYINFYNNKGNTGKLVSSITFNPETMKFIVNNYDNSFGNGKSHYFDLDLYNSNGKKILTSSINNGSTSELTNALNNKSFNYGDIIGLSYNNSISKPVVLNGNNVLSNISGNEEYFKITKDGLVKVNFGQNAYTSSVYWNKNNLVIDSNLADGQSESILNANKKLVILNSNNKIIDSVNTSILNNNNSNVQGVIPESILDKLSTGENYTFALEINNQLFPIKVLSNTPSNSSYLLEGNSDNILTIDLAKKPIVTINNSKEITSYLSTLNSNINSAINANSNINILTNSELNYKITVREFIGRVGATNLENFFNKNEANKEFVNWLLNNKIAMQYYLQGTNPTGININGLQIWSDIWNKYTNSRSGFNLKLAVAVAISNAKPINAWPGSGNVGSPVERYNIFETLNAEGGMLPIFRTLDVRHIMAVVDTHVTNSQILETRAIIMQNHNDYVNSSNNGLNNIAYTIHYNEINPHTGANVFKPGFYGPNPTTATVWYDGGVCGSLSKMGTIACQVFGVPAEAIAQTSSQGGPVVHCAFVFYNNEHKWEVGNNVFGWANCAGGDISGWSNGIATTINRTTYNLLYENADTPALKESNEYLWLASFDISSKDKMNAINEAIKIQPLNLGAWLEKIAMMKSNPNTPVQDYINLANEIISTFKDYPMPMFDTLLQIKNEILVKGTERDYSNFVNSITKVLNSVTDPNQSATAKGMLNLMNKYNMIVGATPLTLSNINLSNVWSQNIGSISFNNITKKMYFSKGWGEINPYLRGEAFNISLETASGKVIKSITLTGGEKPETELYKAFNGTSFNIGDKIVIDYKTSSKISVDNLITEKGVENNYEIKKPTTLYIETNGLSLNAPVKNTEGIKSNHSLEKTNVKEVGVTKTVKKVEKENNTSDINGITKKAVIEKKLDKVKVENNSQQEKKDTSNTSIVNKNNEKNESNVNKNSKDGSAKKINSSSNEVNNTSMEKNSENSITSKINHVFNNIIQWINSWF
ncbi:hypothetical protein [Clostridium massiliamazoniense]|uniref:hypothetical protein n=1 Tax=Clostridium massiliamazoniense TaxID=1347366 RepID=UPI0006D806CD|nr:hypothetical protein [Clostridium massiliamazoniense]